MKQCSACATLLPLDAFPSNAHKADGLSHYCRPCKKQSQHDWYVRHRATQRAKLRTSNKRTNEANARWVLSYLLTHPCVDCGATNPVVLEFDHRDPGTKRYAISRLLTNAISLTTLQAEVALCDVRCANCHRVRTSQQFGWAMLRWLRATG